MILRRVMIHVLSALRFHALACAVVASIATSASAAVLEAGPGKPFASIDQAVAAAKKGDEVRVFPPADGKADAKVAVLVRTPGLTIRAADDKHPVKIDGEGFDYSGAGRVPRAIFQFDRAATGCTLEGFELTGAHNKSFNGAGVRINAANDVTIRRCIIRGNDMGIMSNGELKDQTGARQLIENCLIEKNGSEKDPGYNHNLYLGGTSVTVRGCEIAWSLTGHNLKSRAHQNWIEYNYIHDSANREVDLVDAAGATDAPGSDAVLLGNIIEKRKNMPGNKAVIHFGKDGKADRKGTIWLVHNTIGTPYISPLLELSTPDVNAVFLNNLLRKEGGGKGDLIAARSGGRADAASGKGNSFVGAFANVPAAVEQGPLVAWDKLALPWEAFGKNPEPLMEYAGEQQVAPRRTAAAGAGGGAAGVGAPAGK